MKLVWRNLQFRHFYNSRYQYLESALLMLCFHKADVITEITNCPKFRAALQMPPSDG
jgi:hypothetical protein